MRNKVLAALVAGGLLVGAGFVTSVVSSPNVASAQEDTAESEASGPITRAMDFLNEVLSELVEADTIDQADADAVLNAVEAKATEKRAEHEAMIELLKSLLDDGVLTEDEASQLPEDHPLLSERFDEAWEDGQLTKDEIPRFKHDRRDTFKRGFRFGGLLDDGGIDVEEYANLPDDHPLVQADTDEYLSDGLITVEELRDLWGQIKADHLAESAGA